MKPNRATSQPNRKVSRYTLTITLTLLIATTVICAVITGDRVASVTRPQPVSALAEVGSNQLQGGRDEVRIELTNNGFMPGEVTHLSGTFAIAVENTGTAGEYTLRLKTEDGAVLKEVSVQKGSTAWSVTLQAGRYTLTEANHPQWICNINVQ